MTLREPAVVALQHWKTAQAERAKLDAERGGEDAPKVHDGDALVFPRRAGGGACGAMTSGGTRARSEVSRAWGTASSPALRAT